MCIRLRLQRMICRKYHSYHHLICGSSRLASHWFRSSSDLMRLVRLLSLSPRKRVWQYHYFISIWLYIWERLSIFGSYTFYPWNGCVWTSSPFLSMKQGPFYLPTYPYTSLLSALMPAAHESCTLGWSDPVVWSAEELVARKAYTHGDGTKKDDHYGVGSWRREEWNSWHWKRRIR